MDELKEQPKFEIQKVIEQKPLKSHTSQAFFSRWCEINDSIVPLVVNRAEWEERKSKGILESSEDGKKNLFVPDDLQLWEMIGVIEAVDHDTFANKPERQQEGKEKINNLAKDFQNSGVYIAKRLDGIDQGRNIAEALALEFYEYGQSLDAGKRPDEPPEISKIASLPLTPEETEKVDRLLAGDNKYNLYNTRAKKVTDKIDKDPDQKDELYESERQRTLAQFFRVADKAFALKEKSEHGELQENTAHLKPWQNKTPIHNEFLKNVERSITQKIETPKAELDSAIFRRGIQNLITEIPTPGWRLTANIIFEILRTNLRLEQKKLYDSLDIPRLKSELDIIRQTGNTSEISKKEQEIADKIQKQITHYPSREDANNPSEILATKYINCVGASILGGGLMKETGLNYLVGSVPEHSILLLVTSGGQIQWRDMLNMQYNEMLTDEMIDGQKKDNSPLEIKDIVEFSQNPSPSGLMFDIKGPEYRNKVKWAREGYRQYVTVFEPEYGQKIQLLSNTGAALKELGENELDSEKKENYYNQAVLAMKHAITLDPNYDYLYINLGNAFYNLNRNEEAIEAYQKAIEINPQDFTHYINLGNAFYNLNRNEEAIESFYKAMDLDPGNIDALYRLAKVYGDYLN